MQGTGRTPGERVVFCQAQTLFHPLQPFTLQPFQSSDQSLPPYSAFS
jgi:hypothetical protein